MGGAIAAEVCATLLLKASDGFGRPLVGVVALAGFGLALWLLSAALQRLPISVAYPVWIGLWIGVGSVVVSVAGGVVVLNLGPGATSPGGSG